MCAVVKADAYHLGARRVAEYLDRTADFFAVATAEEALELCDAVTKPVLILGFPEEGLEEAVRRGIRVTVSDLRQAERLGRCPGALAHLKFDSGMNRLGFRDPAELLTCFGQDFFVEGVFTHLFSETSVCRRYQLDRFSEVAALCRARQPRILTHIGGSGIAEAEALPYEFDMLRTGISLYRGAARLMSRIIGLKEVGPEDYLSYGETLSGKRRRIAVVSCGYADGLPRGLSGRWTVRVKGRPCPVVGAVCMDMFLADVTDADAEIGGEVAVLEDFAGAAELLGTIDYELLVHVSNRVQRVYK